jgi:hypothetical protein
VEAAVGLFGFEQANGLIADINADSGTFAFNGCVSLGA